MAKEIRVGLVNEARTQVTEANIASTMGSGSLRVFATPATVSYTHLTLPTN